MESRWRLRARPIIAQILREHPDADERELRRLISAAYPFGERAMHPYKCWLTEVREQLDVHFRRVRPKPANAAETRRRQREVAREQAGQLSLLEEMG
jgi:hypothetical protein